MPLSGERIKMSPPTSIRSAAVGLTAVRKRQAASFSRSSGGGQHSASRGYQAANLFACLVRSSMPAQEVADLSADSFELAAQAMLPVLAGIAWEHLEDLLVAGHLPGVPTLSRHEVRSIMDRELQQAVAGGARSGPSGGGAVPILPGDAGRLVRGLAVLAAPVGALPVIWPQHLR